MSWREGKRQAKHASPKSDRLRAILSRTPERNDQVPMQRGKTGEGDTTLAETGITVSNTTPRGTFDSELVMSPSAPEPEYPLIKLFCFQRIGEILRELPTRQGKRSDLTSSDATDKVTRQQAITSSHVREEVTKAHDREHAGVKNLSQNSDEDRAQGCECSFWRQNRQVFTALVPILVLRALMNSQKRW